MVRTRATLRFRLTAVASLVVAVVLSAAAVLLVEIERRELVGSLDDSLVQRADTLEAGLAAGLALDSVIPADDGDRAVQVVSVDGRILSASANLAGAAPLPAEIGPDRTQTIRTDDGLPLDDDVYRVLTRYLDTDAGAAVLHVIENRDDVNDTIGNLTATLGIAVPTVVVALAGLMWWLVARALAPVDRIRSDVDAIDETRGDRRVHVPDRDDEISRLAVTMNRMLDRLDDVTERRRRFVDDAAHELRTPLARIRTMVEVDVARPSHADPMATVGAVRDETVALQDLIDDLLHLARSDAGDDLAVERPVDLDDIVLDEIRALRSAADVTVDARGVSAAHLCGHPAHLRRVVRNLLSNAVQHAASTVTVGLAETGDAVVLSVADDGPGVPADVRDRIFERFARVDGARSRDRGGTGLGLAIARDIVDRHGGSIAYDDTWVDGARFVVRLPRDR